MTDAKAKLVDAVPADYKYHIHCNATVPSLVLTIGAVQLEVQPAERIERPFAGDTKCRFNMYPDAYTSTFFSIGAGVARNNCHIFDLENKRLGVAPNLDAR